jgi:hypothetical protein
MDYPAFEAAVIHPFFRAAKIRRAEFAASELPLEFLPGRPSLEEFFQFLQETDLNSHANHTSTTTLSPGSPSMDTSSFLLPFVPLAGFISRKRLDTFIWTGGVFKKGSVVMLGKSGRTGMVKGICGIGRNYIMRGFEESGPKLDGEVQIRRMVVSTIPSSPGLLLVYRLLSRIFPIFLGSMLDFMDKSDDEDEEEDEDIMETSTASLGMITSPSEIYNMDPDEYSK